VPSERIRADKLLAFVDDPRTRAGREKLTVQGMQMATAQFAQLAGEVPDDLMTLRAKLALLSRCLPTRYAGVVLEQEAKKPTPALHEVINIVLAKAANKEQAVAYGGGSSSSGSASASVNAVSLAAVASHFGWTAEEAAAAFGNDEGWQEHDTSGNQRASTGPVAFAGTGRLPDDQVELIINAVATRLAADPGGQGDGYRGSHLGGSGVAKEVPAGLADSRKHAGLCIKCGVTRYAPGIKGHNAATCTAKADTTTSAADGLKAADE
jgi:hypothetical protein